MCFNSEILYKWKLIWQTLLKSQASGMSKWVQFSFNCFLNPMCWEKTTEWKLLIKMLTCGTAEPQSRCVACRSLRWHAYHMAPSSATSIPSFWNPSLCKHRNVAWHRVQHRSDVTFQGASSLRKPSSRIIHHGIILWIICSDHGSSRPNIPVFQLILLLLGMYLVRKIIWSC